MTLHCSFYAALLSCLVLGLPSCSSDGKGGEHSSTEDREEGGGESRGEHGGERAEHDGERAEHDREGGEHGAEGEEPGTELALDAKYDRVRNGARLVLAYDAASNSFVGSVQNTTTRKLEQVRVEVHLSNGRELGPTPPADLAPGATRPVTLQAESRGFDGWTAHP